MTQTHELEQRTDTSAAGSGLPGPGDAGGIGRSRQRAIYSAGVAGRRPSAPVELEALERTAAYSMDAEAYAYIAGGAGTESTMRANRAAFDRWRIVPRVLRDVATRDTSIELLGRTLPMPVLTAPIGVLEMCHPDADVAVARAAAAAGVPMVFSSQASVSMEACAAAMGDAPRWFQLYWSTDDRVVRSFVTRAKACGCEAIVLTLDTTMLGWRTRDLQLGHLPFLRGKGIAQYTSDPEFIRLLDEEPLPDDGAPKQVTPASIAALFGMARRVPGGTLANVRSGRALEAVRRFTATYSRPSLTWEQVARVRDYTDLPVLLKGVVHPDDATRAMELGLDGLVVSNHGGRQVDGAIATLDALPGVVDAVAGRAPVLLDSGIRSGADVFKALALGADAVLLGRPYAYGLALGGEAGVADVLANLHADLDLTLGLAGHRSVRGLAPDALVRD
jgi:isopentenyl diphosphate isomerase/L-lactate dehydrogenase-like FMN-dependent dehydrogenase